VDRVKKARKLYESPQGDRWYLIREPSGGVFVRHESSGGDIKHVEGLSSAETARNNRLCSA
jgi:hypothetical protein